MQLRHIRPRSVEWYDAVEQSQLVGGNVLSQEDTVRLRTLVELDSFGEESKEALTGLAGGGRIVGAS